jgi:phosphohistidine phosphatase
MALFLVQHGISASKDVDPQKGLTSQGITETERIAKVAKGYGIKVGRIVHSGKKRAEQTASIFHKELSLNSPLEVISGINPLDDVRAFAEIIIPESELMVVGHMPFLQRLVSYLTTGSEEILIYQFQNSGIVCLSSIEEINGKIDWFIKWTLNPNIS